MMYVRCINFEHQWSRVKLPLDPDLIARDTKLTQKFKVRIGGGKADPRYVPWENFTLDHKPVGRGRTVMVNVFFLAAGFKT